MANTYHQIYLHAVFAVKYREAAISKEWSECFFGIIGNLIKEADCKTIIVNGMEDHVHCLFNLKPTVALSELMKMVKSRSSKYVNDHQLTRHRFEWQEGYGIFSYSQSQIEDVYRYIQQQEAHHQKRTFLKEYEELLKLFDISYDMNYIFHEMK
jgi:REP element-mobilizing transposase RayT